MATQPRRARPSGTGRYPMQLVLMTSVAQDRAVRDHSDAVGSSINEVLRQAIAAGLPILRKRAKEDGTLSSAVA